MPEMLDQAHNVGGAQLRMGNRRSEGAKRSWKLKWLLHVWEWTHFQQLGEVSDISFDWWWNKYKPNLSRKSARRAWEICKAALRRYEVKFALIQRPSGPHNLRLDPSNNIQNRIDKIRSVMAEERRRQNREYQRINKKKLNKKAREAYRRKKRKRKRGKLQTDL